MDTPLLPKPCFDQHKKSIFVVMLFGFLTQCMNLSILGPFFPIKAKEYDIGESMIGLIFSGFPLGAILCTLFIRKWMDHHRKNFMMTGVILYVVGMTGFASIFYLDNKNVIIIGSIICRFIMGMGMSMYDTPSLSFIPLLFSHKIDKKLGIIEGIQNVGFMLGPLLGTLLYNIGNYEVPFFAMAALQSITLPLLLFLIPKQQDISEYIRASSFQARQLFQQESQDIKSEQEKDHQFILSIHDDQISEQQRQIQRIMDVNFGPSVFTESDDNKQSSVRVSYLHSIIHFRVFLIAIMIFLTASGFLFLDSSYASFLQNEFDLDQNLINYLFVASYSCSTISAYFVSLITHSRPTNIKLMFGGFCVGFICYFFIGPAKFLYLPSNLILTIVSRCLIASCQSIVYIPAIKELYFTLSSLYHNHTEDDQIISNMASTFYIISMQSGEFLGPVVGDIITEYLSFQEASTYLAIFAISTIILVNIFKRAFKPFDFEDHHFHFFSVKQKLADINSTYQRSDENLSQNDSSENSSPDLKEKSKITS